MSSPSLAKRLWAARRDAVAIAITADETPADEASSCAVQAEAIAASRLARVGWKVGSTSKEAQRLLGTSGPGTCTSVLPTRPGDRIRLDLAALGPLDMRMVAARTA